MSAKQADSDFGKEVGLVHKMIVTGRKVGAGSAFYAALADNEKFFQKVFSFFLSAKEDNGLSMHFSLQDLQVIIQFNDVIFEDYPIKAMEVSEKLLSLIRSNLNILPVGELRLEVMDGLISLSFTSKNVLVCADNSFNAYGLAIKFLKKENTREYIKSINYKN